MLKNVVVTSVAETVLRNVLLFSVAPLPLQRGRTVCD